MFVSRIFVCRLSETVRSVRDGDCFCRQIATRSLGIEFPEYTLQNRRSEMFIVT